MLTDSVQIDENTNPKRINIISKTKDDKIVQKKSYNLYDAKLNIDRNNHTTQLVSDTKKTDPLPTSEWYDTSNTPYSLSMSIGRINVNNIPNDTSYIWRVGHSFYFITEYTPKLITSLLVFLVLATIVSIIFSKVYNILFVIPAVAFGVASVFYYYLWLNPKYKKRKITYWYDPIQKIVNNQ